MDIIDYTTSGGKNLIDDYLDNLPKKEMLKGYQVKQVIIENGSEALQYLDTRQLRGKLWEIKFYANRIMYILKDGDTIYFLHACKKQKGKAEKHELYKAIKRAKEFGLQVD